MSRKGRVSKNGRLAVRYLLYVRYIPEVIGDGYVRPIPRFLVLLNLLAFHVLMCKSHCSATIK